MTTQANGFFALTTYAPVPGSELVVVAWQLKTPENVGSIIRTAANVGASRVLVVQPDGVNYKRYKYERVAGAALQQLSVLLVTPDEVWNHLADGMVTVALETSPGSGNLYLSALPDKMALMVGNEQDGLPADVLSRCAMAVHIPMPGTVKSMNVSHAAAVAVFEWYRQMSLPGAG